MSTNLLLIVIAITIRVEGGVEESEQQLVASELYTRLHDKEHRWGESWEQVLFRDSQYECWTDKSRKASDVKQRAESLKEEDDYSWDNALMLAELLLNERFNPVVTVTHHHTIGTRKPRSWSACAKVCSSEYHFWYYEG